MSCLGRRYAFHRADDGKPFTFRVALGAYKYVGHMRAASAGYGLILDFGKWLQSFYGTLLPYARYARSWVMYRMCRVSIPPSSSFDRTHSADNHWPSLASSIAGLGMSRRGYPGDARRGSVAGNDVSTASASPYVAGYCYRGVSTTRKPEVQSMPTAVLDHSTRDTPTQAVPFTPARKSYEPSGPTSTRKISASFSTDHPRKGRPTVASSSITASTSVNQPGPLTSHPINRFSNMPSPRRQPSQHRGHLPDDKSLALKSSHTYSHLPLPPTTEHRARTPTQSSGVDRRKSLQRYASGRRNAENIPPSRSMASIPLPKHRSMSTRTTPNPAANPPSPKRKEKERATRPAMPLSRTFSVFSNLTASISRTSLGQLAGHDSRRTSPSTSSKAHHNYSTLSRSKTKDKEKAKDKNKDGNSNTPYLNSQSAASSSSSKALLSPGIGAGAEQPNHQLVYTAQSSAYWAGRFMALQDRFQAETLRPENLTKLAHAYGENPLVGMTQQQPGLTSSATTSCITASNTYKPLQSLTGSTSPRKTQPPHPYQHQQLSKVKQGSQANVPMPFPFASTSAANATGTANVDVPGGGTGSESAALLIDEDARIRRIFAHLDALCASTEARNSLQSWQHGYIRQTGKEYLLPSRGSSRKKTKELTFFSRLFRGGSGGSLKKSAIGSVHF
ncbi:hypothetical protein F4808DRAFT_459776 [Astrocystis sublimbata]|nr:hypothetical protein F4808DRAFT_459776 [Astrocystis sublimbata]